MKQLLDQIRQATEAIKTDWEVTPRVGVILGTGLGGLADALDREATFPYSDLPNFPRSTSLGHEGRLACGRLDGTPVVMMQGRLHRYEGYSMQQVTLPVRVMRALGASVLIVSNASGGLNPSFAVGGLMIIEDHINMMFGNPLIGINDDRLGPRFPDMSAPYDPDLIAAGLRAARKHGIRVYKGVYAGFLGPSFETRAEYRMLRRLGADAVGMSTVPEVIAAVHGGASVFGLSVVTNLGLPDQLAESSGDEVVETATQSARNAERIVRDVVASLDS